jgi:hypothetical protein
MTPWHERAESLIAQWELYKNARPRNDAVNLQIDRDSLSKWATNLHWNLLWGQDTGELAEACHQFETRLATYKDKVVIEILTHGSV